MRKTDIVVTTIFEPAWLRGYTDNLRKYGREDEATIRIICDRKTPKSVFEAAREAAAEGFGVDCPDLDEQSAYLQKLGLDNEFIPWNTDNRRNIGFLRAWEEGAEVLISIDDDNYCRGGSDFVGAHHVVGSLYSADGGDITTRAPWFNICRLLDANIRDDFYPRGYPYAARKPEARAELTGFDPACEGMTVSVNAGLWLDDPDVDAVSRLAQSPRVAGARGSVFLSPDTWSPINTQNTALLREALPAYYYVRMGFPIKGMSIDRYGDILSGYFLQKCAKHLGHLVRFGDPVADHCRSPHNLFKDLYHELAGMVVIEEFVPWLREQTLEGDTYLDAYACLADSILEHADRFKGFVWDDGGREFLRDTGQCMQRWLQVMRNISGERP